MMMMWFVQKKEITMSFVWMLHTELLKTEI